jgi:hypothetical protein
MHLGAIDATALLEDHHQALAFIPRRLDVFGNIPERQRKPVLLVQTVLADLRRPGLDGKAAKATAATITCLIIICLLSNRSECREHLKQPLCDP